MKQLSITASLATAVLLASATLANAQETVPFGYLNKTGSGSTSYPFGRTTPIRIQYLYDSTLVGKAALPIRELAFRANENATVVAKSNVEVEISLSSSPNDIFGASTTFASNRGTNVVVAFKKKMVNLPAFTPANPQPFAAVFKLDSAFVYTRTSGNLLIEYVITNTTTGGYSHDTEFARPASITAIGTACGGANQAVSGGTSTAASSFLRFTLSGGPASAAAVHVLGFQKLANPVPLPFGGCSLYIAPFAIFAFATDATGGSVVSYPIPLGTRSGSGPVVYGQWVGIGATSWSSSPAHEVVIGGYLPHGRIFNLTSATSPTGSKQIGSGIIHRMQ